jgi:glycogen debranching enzyme
MLSGNDKLAKNTLIKYLDAANEALLPRFVGESTGVNEHIPAADGMGWLFHRIRESKLNKKDLMIVERKLGEVLDKLFSERLQEGLIVNEVDETWMDTTYKDDIRTGARIEIQALTLSMLNYLGELRGKPDPRERKLKQEVVKQFWNGKILKDGSEDKTIRPNIFLAYYVYPKLLSKKDWQTCFDNSLKKLWLEWGGLSSIDIQHKLFTEKSTGENIKSYHRGDSWYWINNIAAISMHRLNPKKYSEYINKILKASTHEQQSMGISGCCAEISSANTIESGGCQNQLWSNATLIELIHELNL